MKFNEFRKVKDAMSETSVGMKCGFSLVHKFSGITKMHTNKKCLAIALCYNQHMLTQGLFQGLYKEYQKEFNFYLMHEIIIHFDYISVDLQ